VGHNLLGQLEGKAETWRLDNENSEDALSFNVFRSLQEAGALAAAVRLLAGIDVTEEPELVVWGRRLGPASTHLVPELQAALAELEPWPGQKTEPDVILRVPGWGWISSRRSLQARRRRSRTSQRSSRPGRRTTAARERSTIAAVEAANPASIPEQVLRNVAVAHRVAGRERAAVLALVRDGYAKSVEARAGAYLVDDSIFTGAATWEQLFGLTKQRDGLARLREYMVDKSVNLRPAFVL
jgi:hypothetical protein